MVVKNLCRQIVTVKAQAASLSQMVHQGLLQLPGQNPIVHKQRKLCGWLVCLQGPQKGQDFRLFDGNYRIGAHPRADLVFTGPEMRSYHAKLKVTATGVLLSPEASDRDVSVNGDTISRETELHDGDDINLGQLRFQFRIATLFQPGYRPLYRNRVNTQLIFSLADQDYVTGWLLPTGPLELDIPDVRLSNRPITIGAAEHCELRFGHCGLAEEHARISFVQNQLILEPLQAESAPCLVNNHMKTQKTPLSDSDQISLGRFSAFVKTW
jgi:pSer/pThr/pTyr-binding forkhead associated (FHA) protein